jgi:hypothetical protein
VELLDSVLDEFGELDNALHGVRHSLDDNGVSFLGGEHLNGSSEVSANADSSSNSDLVRGEGLGSFLYSSVLFCHTVTLQIFKYEILIYI